MPQFKITFKTLTRKVETRELVLDAETAEDAESAFEDVLTDSDLMRAEVIEERTTDTFWDEQRPIIKEL